MFHLARGVAARDHAYNHFQPDSRWSFYVVDILSGVCIRYIPYLVQFYDAFTLFDHFICVHAVVLLLQTVLKLLERKVLHSLVAV